MAWKTSNPNPYQPHIFWLLAELKRARNLRVTDVQMLKNQVGQLERKANHDQRWFPGGDSRANFQASLVNAYIRQVTLAQKITVEIIMKMIIALIEVGIHQELVIKCLYLCTNSPWGEEALVKGKPPNQTPLGSFQKYGDARPSESEYQGKVKPSALLKGTPGDRGGGGGSAGKYSGRGFGHSLNQ